MGEKDGQIMKNKAEDIEDRLEDRVESSDPCSRWPPVCGQVCVSTVSGHRCECVQGYIQDPRDYNHCKPREGFN